MKINLIDKKRALQERCKNALATFLFDTVGAKKKSYQKKNAVGEFRRLRTATGVSPPAHEKLLKKFYQNFHSGGRAKPEALLAPLPRRCASRLLAIGSVKGGIFPKAHPIGDLGDRESLLDHLLCRRDPLGGEIREERGPRMLTKRTAKIVLADKKAFGKLIQCQIFIQMPVDISDHAKQQLLLRCHGLCGARRAEKQQNLRNDGAHHHGSRGQQR